MRSGLEDSEAQGILDRLKRIPETDSPARSEALGEFLGFVSPVIRKLVSRYTRMEPRLQRADQDDLEQQVLLRLYTSLHKLTPPIDDINRFYAYCSVLVRNQIIDSIRSRRGRWRSRANLEPLPEGREIDESLEEPIERATRAENTRILLDAIESLPEIERNVIKLKYLDGLSSNEISERLSLHRMTIHRVASRAMARLREQFLNDE